MADRVKEGIYLLILQQAWGLYCLDLLGLDIIQADSGSGQDIFRVLQLARTRVADIDPFALQSLDVFNGASRSGDQGDGLRMDGEYCPQVLLGPCLSPFC